MGMSSFSKAGPCVHFEPIAITCKWLEWVDLPTDMFVFLVSILLVNIESSPWIRHGYE